MVIGKLVANTPVRAAMRTQVGYVPRASRRVIMRPRVPGGVEARTGGRGMSCFEEFTEGSPRPGS